MSSLNMRTEWDSVLVRVCSINEWEHTTKNCWKTDNGSWHSLRKEELRELEDTFAALSVMARGAEKQWIIEANVLTFIKNILAWPSSEQEHCAVISSAWQLLLDLILDSSNQYLIWMEFNDILMQDLQQNIYRNDTCRHIIYNIYVVARRAQHEGTRILKILLNHFTLEGHNGPLKEQGLTMLLEHFTAEERSISLMYQQLLDVEKSAFMKFIVDYVSNPRIDGTRTDDPISPQLLHCICNDFIAKNAIISLSSIAQILELFEVIAHASAYEHHQMNQFNFSLLLNAVHLFQYVRSNDEVAEKVFVKIQRNSKEPLKEIILKTIINLARDNEGHKRKAGETGLIEILVDFVSGERCGYLYKCMLYALNEMCQTIPANMALVEETAKRKDDWTGSVAVHHFLYDMHYKGKRIY